MKEKYLRFNITYQRCGHGDVEKLSSATLRDRSGEEELVSIFGKERRLVLKRGEKLQKRACRAFYIFVCLLVHAHTE